jgi:hypothetical protein
MLREELMRGEFGRKMSPGGGRDPEMRGGDMRRMPPMEREYIPSGDSARGREPMGRGPPSMSEALRMYVDDDRMMDDFPPDRHPALGKAVPRPPPPPVMPHSARATWSNGGPPVPPPVGGGSEQLFEKARQKLFRR